MPGEEGRDGQLKVKDVERPVRGHGQQSEDFGKRTDDLRDGATGHLKREEVRRAGRGMWPVACVW